MTSLVLSLVIALTGVDARVYPAMWGCADPDGVVLYVSCCHVKGAAPICLTAEAPELLHMFEDACVADGYTYTQEVVQSCDLYLPTVGLRDID